MCAQLTKKGPVSGDTLVTGAQAERPGAVPSSSPSLLLRVKLPAVSAAPVLYPPGLACPPGSSGNPGCQHLPLQGTLGLLASSRAHWLLRSGAGRLEHLVLPLLQSRPQLRAFLGSGGPGIEPEITSPSTSSIPGPASPPNHRPVNNLSAQSAQGNLPSHWESTVSRLRSLLEAKSRCVCVCVVSGPAGVYFEWLPHESMSLCLECRKEHPHGLVMFCLGGDLKFAAKLLRTEFL